MTLLSPPSSATAPRLAIYGVGQFGKMLTRFAVAKGWPIVAAYNRSGSQIGQDLGRLAGLDRDLGVVVQDADKADYTALDADLAIVATTNRLTDNLPAYRRLLGAGVNVLCHGAESYFPQSVNASIASEIDDLARTHGVTFTGGGIWDMSRIWMGLAAAGPCTELRALRHSSISDAATMGLEQMLICGVGMTPDQYRERIAKRTGTSSIGGMYTAIPHLVLARLGFTINSIEEKVEPVIFDTPVRCDLLDRDVEPGECVGTRMLIEIQTVEGVTASARIEPRLFLPGEIEHTLWEVDGRPTTRIRVERDDQAHYTAASLFNRIRDVIEAPPGIRTVTELGLLRPTLM